MTTVTPIEVGVRFRIKERSDLDHMRVIVTRWLERGVAKRGRHINERSVRLETMRDPALRQTFLYASAQSFPDTLPDWLRTYSFDKGVRL